MSTTGRHARAVADRAEWTVAIALKGLSDGKSRLSPFLSVAERAELVVAMASDVVAAVAASDAVREIVVVTPEIDLARRLGGDVVVLREWRASGLNDAYVRAREAVGRGPLALVAADLPRLRTADIDRVTSAAEGSATPVVVADCEGSGTTVLASTDATLLRPRFGVDSRAAHIAGGAEDVSAGFPPSVRHDVDTFASLAALCSGDAVGRATGDWLSRMSECLGDVCLPCPHDLVAAWAAGGVR
jgi:2-phospho-L-lactate guanylyltransferase